VKIVKTIIRIVLNDVSIDDVVEYLIKSVLVSFFTGGIAFVTGGAFWLATLLAFCCCLVLGMILCSPAAQAS
jgi:hypothetical protein